MVTETEAVAVTKKSAVKETVTETVFVKNI